MESKLGSSNSVVFEAKDLFSKYTINVVARAAFGVDGECFTNPDSAFYNMTTSIFKISTMNIIRDFIFLVFPIVNHILQVRYVLLCYLLNIDAICLHAIMFLDLFQ